MKKAVMNYETLLRITDHIASSREFEDITILTVAGMRRALDAMGCALFLYNRKTNELELAAADGLSQDYLNKGSVSALESIAASLEEGPVMIYDVTDDPRLQYPQEAVREGIHSILSVPIKTSGRSIGTLRIYTAEPWEATLEDVNFVQAVAQLAAMAIENSRLVRGLKDSIEILREQRDPRTRKSDKWTPHESVPRSVPRPTPAAT